MNIKRAVIKVGTSCLTYNTGRLNLKHIEELVRVISDLKNRGIEIILVSSGAIGAGVGRLKLSEKPEATQKKQALAAIGQVSLISIYDKFFSEYGHLSAQVLLTKNVLEDKTRYTNAVNAFETMFEYGVVPIVNENDVISTYEIEFGDNDTLSAYVARLVKADLLILLSDIDGFFDSNPVENKNARLIPVIEEITEDIISRAGGSGTRRGTGGMKTKLNAAEIAGEAGIDMIITNGARLENLYDIFDGKQTGTLFKSKNN